MIDLPIHSGTIAHMETLSGTIPSDTEAVNAAHTMLAWLDALDQTRPPSLADATTMEDFQQEILSAAGSQKS